MRKRIFILVLMAAMAFAVCACGASDSGNSEQSEEKATEKVSESDEAENDAAEEKVFWVEVVSPDKVNICLKDEAVNRLKGGSADRLNEILVRFYIKDKEIINFALSVEGKSASISENPYISGNPYYESEPLENHYENDIVCWTIEYSGIAELIKKCDSANGDYADFEDASNSREIFRFGSAQELASLFAGSDEMETDKGVKLAFYGDMLYVELAGGKLVNAAKENAPVLWLGTADESKIGAGSPDSPYSVCLIPDNLPKSYIDGYSDSAAVKEIWDEEDSEHISVWFYAPGFEDIVKGMKEYYFECWDEGEFAGSYGSLNDILAEYRTFDTPIPEIPSVFPKNVLDDEYFRPMTPNYSVLLVEYPEIPYSTDFQSGYNFEFDYYAFKAFRIDWTSGTQCFLISYNKQGEAVQIWNKCIYKDAHDAVYTHVPQPAYLSSDEPITDPDVQSAWINEQATSQTGYITHADNVIYNSGETSRVSEVLAEGFFIDIYTITPAGEITTGNTEYKIQGHWYHDYGEAYERIYDSILDSGECQYILLFL